MDDKPLHAPALDPMSVTARTGSGYPEPFRSRVTPREKRALGDALGLTKIGINRTTLLPGKESSMRHWHAAEDEFVFVLEGEVTLRSDAGDQLLRPGMCAGFPAGKADAHQFLNLGDTPVVYLEVSNRDPANDSAYYPDVDLHYTAGAEPGAMFTRKDGSGY